MSWRRRFLLVVITLAAVAGFALSLPSDPTQRLSRQAETHLARHEYRAAILDLESSLALDPRQPEARQKLVNLYLLKRRFDSARAVLTTWSALDPDDSRPHFSLGDLWETQSQFDNAADEFEKVLSLAPHHTGARHRLADLYLQQERLGDAKRELEMLVTQDQSDQRARFRLGQIMARDDPSSAIGHLRQALAIGTDPQITHQARELMNVLLDGQTETNRAYAAANLGLAFLETKDITLARRQFAAAVDLDPQYGDGYAYLGYAYTLLHQPDLAREALAKAIALDPASAFAHHIMGNILRSQGQVGPAIDQMKRAMALSPDDPILLSDLALSYLADEDLSAAEEYFVKAADLAPAEPAFASQLTHFYLDRLFKVDAGLAAARRLVGLRPDSGENLDLLGWALYLNGRTDEAEKTLGDALRRAPDLAIAHYHLAVLWEQSGQTTKAKREYERAADLDLTGPIERRAEAALKDLSGAG